MTYLQQERSIAESAAAFDASTAAQAKARVNGVFKIRVLDKLSLESACGTELVLGAGVPTRRVRD